MALLIDLPLQDHLPTTAVKNLVGAAVTGTTNANLMSQSGAGGYYSLSLNVNKTNYVKLSRQDLDTPFTLRFWAKFPQNFGVYKLFSYSLSSANFINIDLMSKNIQLIDSDTDTSIVNLISGLDYSVWHHFALTVGGDSNTYLYIDGVESENTTIVDPWPGLTIDRLGAGLTGVYSVNVNGFKIDNTELSPTQIQNDFIVGRTTGNTNVSVYNTKFYDSSIKKSCIVMGGNTIFQSAGCVGNIDINHIKNKYSGV